MAPVLYSLVSHTCSMQLVKSQLDLLTFDLLDMFTFQDHCNGNCDKDLTPSFPHLQLPPLYLCKLSSILSEQAFLAHLQSFTQSKEKKIMLLVS